MADSESRQLEMMREMVALAEKQTVMSAERSEMSETRSYHNAERTLSVWVRTALSLMILGLAVDRFSLLVYRGPNAAHIAHGVRFDAASSWTGFALVVLGVAVAAATGARFFAYARSWGRSHRFPAHHGPYLGPFFAAMVALFGVVLLVIMILSEA